MGTEKGSALGDDCQVGSELKIKPGSLGPQPRSPTLHAVTPFWINSHHQTWIINREMVWLCLFPLYSSTSQSQDHPGGSDGKESACNAGDPGSIPGLGRSTGEGNGNTLQYSCSENAKDRGDWWATIHEIAKSWTCLTNTFTGISGYCYEFCFNYYELVIEENMLCILMFKFYRSKCFQIIKFFIPWCSRKQWFICSFIEPK